MDLQVGNETIEINDHRMVLQLADEINAYNGGNDTELAVNFIPWYNTHPKYVFMYGLLVSLLIIYLYLTARLQTPEVAAYQTGEFPEGQISRPTHPLSDHSRRVQTQRHWQPL